MRHMLAGVWLLLAAGQAAASAVSGPGYAITLPEGWTHQRDRLGVALMARPDAAQDAQGWGQDLITLTREAVDPKRTCLEGFGYRKLEQLAYHSSQFTKLAQQDLTLGGKPATLFTLRYREGSREIMALVLILADGAHMLTATALSSPERFEARRAALEFSLRSLKAR